MLFSAKKFGGICYSSHGRTTQKWSAPSKKAAESESLVSRSLGCLPQGSAPFSSSRPVCVRAQ